MPGVSSRVQVIGSVALLVLGFRIVQNASIDASPQAQAALKDTTGLTIKGSLEYQACNDKVCFTPQSVPLTWKVTLRPLDRERARP